MNLNSEKTHCKMISWAAIFGNLVTNRTVEALRYSDVHARAQQGGCVVEASTKEWLRRSPVLLSCMHTGAVLLK